MEEISWPLFTVRNAAWAQWWSFFRAKGESSSSNPQPPNKTFLKGNTGDVLCYTIIAPSLSEHLDLKENKSGHESSQGTKNRRQRVSPITTILLILFERPFRYRMFLAQRVRELNYIIHSEFRHCMLVAQRVRELNFSIHRASWAME
ncbi:hypothetical protein E2542_SST26175 [Spatholobus suberectus]|nr:hypothetical protein E2542_SST26175 [Spatholobus suberectus]